MSYNTKQKEIIYDVIKKKSKDFTIKDIYEDLNKKVGLTTIYRFINKLEKDGLLNKSVSDNMTYYNYLEKCNHTNHFYLKCNKCSKMFHIDCECIEVIKALIFNEHNFVLDDKHIIFNGICEKCRGLYEKN